MKSFKRITTIIIMIFAVVTLSAIFTATVSADETEEAVSVTETAEEDLSVATTGAEETAEDNVKAKAIAAAAVIGIVATAGAIGMSLAISKSVEGIARQPEADGKIRTSLMLGLVFVETAIIYALIIAVLIIFVL